MPATRQTPPTPCAAIWDPRPGLLPPPRTYLRCIYIPPPRYSRPTVASTKAKSKTNRSLILPVRVSPAEKALLQERAGGPGKVSAYLRELGLGGTAPVDRVDVPPTVESGPARGPDFEQRVKVVARRMPRRAAEKVVRSEEARERSAAVG